MKKIFLLVIISLIACMFMFACDGGGGSANGDEQNQNIEEPGYVTTPYFSPYGGVKDENISLIIKCHTQDAVIYYTTDGTDPDETSLVFNSSNPIYIAGHNTTITVKAVAYKNNWYPSSITSSTYTIRYDKLSTPEPITSDTVFDVPRLLSLNCPGHMFDPSIKFKYTIDGTDPFTSNTAIDYVDSIPIEHDMTIKAYAYAENKLDSDLFERSYTVRWSSLGSTGNNNSANTPDIAIGSDGKPFIVYIDNDNNDRVRVLKWDNGKTWIDLGLASSGEAGDPYIVVDSTNRPIVVFRDDENDYRAHVMRHNGTSWIDLGFASVDYAYSISMAIGSDDKPVVVTNDHMVIFPHQYYRVNVMKWNSGTSWISLGDNSETVSYSMGPTVSIAMGSDDKPFIAYIDSGNYKTVRVKKWISDNNWQDYGIVNAYETNELILAVDSNNKPAIAIDEYYQPYKSRILVKKWDSGTIWTDLNFTYNSTIGIYNLNITFDFDNNLWAYIDDCYVKKWDGTQWLNMGQVPARDHKIIVSPLDNKPYVVTDYVSVYKFEK